MEVSVCTQGYQCEFIDIVSDDFYCKKCSLVARKLTITSCCGQSYCQACIADIQEQAKPCPECGEVNFTTLQQIKYQQRVGDLQVYCSMKKRGCGWSGTLQQLDTHLKPHLDHCDCLDIPCPLNCNQTIPKNKVDQHMAKDCLKRDYICQHCAFKATYEVVVDTHWPVCIYFPLQCPNLCGVTCERSLIEDHIRMCHLEEVVCEFSGIGCDGKFKREEQEEHTRQNTHKHLTIIAAAAIKMNQQLLQKIQEQGQKIDNFQEQVESKLQRMEQKFHEELRHKSDQLEMALKERTILKRTFAIENFSKEKAKDRPDNWKSPAMYTHVCGYKFCIGIDANGCGDGRGKAMDVYLWAMPGEYDHQLKWPTQACFTIELLHQQGGQNKKHVITTREWWKPERPYTWIGEFVHQYGIYWAFLEHSELEDFLSNDTLHFCFTDITIC